MQLVPAAITINIDPNLFAGSGLALSWHGVLSAAGIVAAALIGRHLAEHDGVPPGRVGDMAIWMVVAGIAGARLLFVWENYQQFVGRPFYTVFLLNEGGISQWGGIFGALLAGYVWCRRNGISFRKILDAGGPATALGLGIGRIGDVINGEHHTVASALPWAVRYVNPHTLGVLGQSVQPEVAYELLWCAVLLAALLPPYWRMKKRLPDGVTGLLWLAVYAAGRFGLSFFRLDSLFLGLRQAQWASLLMILLAVVLSAAFLRRDVTGARGEDDVPVAG